MYVCSYLFKSYDKRREGFNREGSIEARGIIPRAIEQIFGHIQKYASPRMRFLVRASYLQIYNEQVRSIESELLILILLVTRAYVRIYIYACMYVCIL